MARRRRIFSAATRRTFTWPARNRKSRQIKIDQLRELEHALQMKASDGRRKVVIISDADRMGTQAANAFLKTLEEPPNNSLLLLLSAIPEVLPKQSCRAASKFRSGLQVMFRFRANRKS